MLLTIVVLQGVIAAVCSVQHCTTALHWNRAQGTLLPVIDTRGPHTHSYTCLHTPTRTFPTSHAYTHFSYTTHLHTLFLHHTRTHTSYTTHVHTLYLHSTHTHTFPIQYTYTHFTYTAHIHTLSYVSVPLSGVSAADLALAPSWWRVVR